MTRIIDLVLHVAMLALCKKIKRTGRTVLWTPRGRLSRRFLFEKNTFALAYGSHIVFPTRSFSRSTLVHEMVHVRQWRRGGVVFWLEYLVVNKLYGYENNPFEHEAFAAERRYRARSGRRRKRNKA